MAQDWQLTGRHATVPASGTWHALLTPPPTTTTRVTLSDLLGGVVKGGVRGHRDDVDRTDIERVPELAVAPALVKGRREAVLRGGGVKCRSVAFYSREKNQRVGNVSKPYASPLSHTHNHSHSSTHAVGDKLLSVDLRLALVVAGGGHKGDLAQQGLHQLLPAVPARLERRRRVRGRPVVHRRPHRAIG